MFRVLFFVLYSLLPIKNDFFCSIFPVLKWENIFLFKFEIRPKLSDDADCSFVDSTGSSKKENILQNSEFEVRTSSPHKK